MILAIDPGPVQSSIVYWQGGICDHGTYENHTLLRVLRTSEPMPTLVAIESIASYGMPVGRDVFATCYLIGRILEVLRRQNVELVERRDVKLHLCGSARAKDANVRQALIDRVGPAGRKNNPGPTYGISKHDWSALAIALYAQDVLLPRYARHSPVSASG